jgi:hypothetical protein
MPLHEFIRQQVPSLVTVLTNADVVSWVASLPLTLPGLLLCPRTPQPVSETYKVLAALYHDSIALAQAQYDEPDGSQSAFLALLPRAPALPALLYIPSSWGGNTNSAARLLGARWLAGGLTKESLESHVMQVTALTMLPLMSASFRALCLSESAVRSCTVFLHGCSSVLNDTSSTPTMLSLQFITDAMQAALASAPARTTAAAVTMTPQEAKVIAVLNRTRALSADTRGRQEQPPVVGVVFATAEGGWTHVCRAVSEYTMMPTDWTFLQVDQGKLDQLSCSCRYPHK